MKYVILIADGMADEPLKKLKGRTPLEVADKPNMDFIAASGKTGMVNTIPSGLVPGSDIASLSIFGYDPKKYYTGRGPLEAANMGVDLKKEDVAFRCNLVTVKEGKMKDFTAGHISNEEAKELIKFVDKNLGTERIRFYPGLGYRHLTVIKSGPEDALCTPPHDITGKLIEEYLPKGKGAELLNDLMEESIPLLTGHPVNKARIKAGKNMANMVWLWGQGKSPDMPLFRKKYGLRGGVITAVNLIKGLGRVVGMDVINVPGATGYFDTNYIGKANYALRSLKKNDLVIVHVEATDEAGHMGNIKEKIRAIENFDKFIVGRMLEGLKKFGDFRIIVLPDHPTPIALMTHTADPVPFVIFGTGIKKDNIKEFTEKAIRRSKLKVKEGYKLMGLFLK
ncbi:MAG: cofactor-independent phosphoglycerate mutase [Candidatus Saganbacteria bacterium]|nr:cofactor-independent phosphoglycerate mutase [Candidatus Saganbacteria bacterium]